MKRFLCVLFALSLSSALLAAPGAHGPNGEHLEESAHAAGSAQEGRPRLEAFSELFELVAHLQPEALVMMVNRYASNAPVDGALIELDSSGLRVQAEFDPVSGYYRFAAPELVAALALPGVHSLAFSIETEDEFDIVAGALVVAETATPTHASQIGGWLAAAAGLALLVWAGWAIHRHRHAPSRSSHPAGAWS